MDSEQVHANPGPRRSIQTGPGAGVWVLPGDDRAHPTCGDRSPAAALTCSPGGYHSQARAPWDRLFPLAWGQHPGLLSPSPAREADPDHGGRDRAGLGGSTAGGQRSPSCSCPPMWEPALRPGGTRGALRLAGRRVGHVSPGLHPDCRAGSRGQCFQLWHSWLHGPPAPAKTGSLPPPPLHKAPRTLAATPCRTAPRHATVHHAMQSHSTQEQPPPHCQPGPPQSQPHRSCGRSEPRRGTLPVAGGCGADQLLRPAPRARLSTPWCFSARPRVQEMPGPGSNKPPGTAALSRRQAGNVAAWLHGPRHGELQLCLGGRAPPAPA